MLLKMRLIAGTLVAATAGALLGCPSLGEIGVGGGDAGADIKVDRAGDHPLAEDRMNDAAVEPTACSKDLATDPKNCGRCSHDCREGACKGGVCQAYAIVTGNAGPSGVAVQDGGVYFTSIDDTVEKCTADDCSNTTVVMASGQQYPRGIATDTTNVYWANSGFFVEAGFGGSITTCGLSGCPSGTTMDLASLEQWPADLAVDTRAVYWTDVYGKAVRSCRIGGCSGVPTTLANDPTLLSGVAIDDTSIYWAEPKLGNVIQCPLGGCPTFTPFASGQVNPAKLDVAQGTLFWSAGDAIMSCATSGCAGAPTVFAQNQVGAYAIAHDATTLYWTLLENDGKVLSCPLAGCTMPTVLADMQAQPSALAVDDASVYWANSRGGTVMRVMK